MLICWFVWDLCSQILFLKPGVHWTPMVQFAWKFFSRQRVKLDIYFYRKLIGSTAHSPSQLSFNCMGLPSFLQNQRWALRKIVCKFRKLRKLRNCAICVAHYAFFFCSCAICVALYACFFSACAICVALYAFFFSACAICVCKSVNLIFVAL